MGTVKKAKNLRTIDDLKEFLREFFKDKKVKEILEESYLPYKVYMINLKK